MLLLVLLRLPARPFQLWDPGGSGQLGPSPELTPRPTAALSSLTKQAVVEPHSPPTSQKHIHCMCLLPKKHTLYVSSSVVQTNRQALPQWPCTYLRRVLVDSGGDSVAQITHSSSLAIAVDFKLVLVPLRGDDGDLPRACKSRNQPASLQSELVSQDGQSTWPVATTPQRGPAAQQARAA